MPYYEYHCETNGQTVEVRHGMNEHVDTWGQAAEMAGVELGDTPATAPVARLMSVTAPTPNGTPGGFQGCGTGCACAPN